VDVYLEGSGLNEFERETWWNTLPGSLTELQGGAAVFQDAMEPWIHAGFEALGQSTRIETERPRFAFIHVPSPHFPIVFAPDGSRADPRFGRNHPRYVEASPSELRDAYAGQVAYVNDRVIDALDAMDRGPDDIVILLSDHGPEFGLDWDNGIRSDLSVRFGAFFAAMAPGITYDDDVKVEESLLEVLRDWGLTTLPPLEDRFFATDAQDKYVTMTEVGTPWPSR
jgi:arylsulfatase A-like enzyme